MKPLKKHLLSLALALVMIVSLVPVAHAAIYEYPVEGGNLKFDPTTGTITDCDTSVYSADIPEKIYDVPVTKIGKEAFRSCNKLTSVTIPSSVTSIGYAAFYGCSMLTSIVIPDSVTEFEAYGSSNTYFIFYGCKQLESITIPGSVKSISRLFDGCDNLKSVTIGDGVEEIGWGTFRCKALEEITFPDSVKSIAGAAFSNCKVLQTVTFGSGLKHIDNNAFSSCPALESLYFRGDAPGATDKMISGKLNSPLKIYYPEGVQGWTSPTWNGYITQSYALPKEEEQKPQQPQEVLATATPTASTVYVNGTAVAFDAYNIGGSNYFKLRDLAFILSGSPAQFEVSWNGETNSIELTSGKSYTPVGGEMSAGGTINKVAKQTSSTVYVNGTNTQFTAYNIDGSNYFRLRDIGQTFQFSVEWDDVQRCISIDTSLPYRAE